MSEENKKITASIILEAVGKPPKYLVETLENVAEKLSNEKGTKILNKKINEPVPLKEKKEFFTTFAEIEIEVDKIMNLVLLAFKYMPAHIEIIEPENVSLSNNGWNDVLNELTRRLHGYDDIARIMQREKAILETKLREILEKPDDKKKSSKKKDSKKKK